MISRFKKIANLKRRETKIPRTLMSRNLIPSRLCFLFSQFNEETHVNVLCIMCKSYMACLQTSVSLSLSVVESSVSAPLFVQSSKWPTILGSLQFETTICLYFSSIGKIHLSCNFYRNFQSSLQYGTSSVVLVDDFSTTTAPPLSRKKRAALEISLGK